eukprot:8494-Heterococcus_DN1.PRE.3
MIMTLLKSQGLPSVVGVTQGLDLVTNGKLTKDLRSYGQRFFHTEFPDGLKQADSNSGVQLIRAVTSAPVKTIHWRGIRSYFMAESAAYEPVQTLQDSNGSSSSTGLLNIKGATQHSTTSTSDSAYITDCINHTLVHVCGLGQYKLQQVNKAVEPCPMKAERYGSSNSDVQDDEVLAIADPELQDSLAMEAQVDELAGEQTWPTEEELANAAHDDSDDDESSDKKAGPLRPNGWSTYQASWLESDDTSADNNAADSAMMDFCNTTNSSNKQLGSGVVDAEDYEKWHNGDDVDGLLSDNDSDNDSMDMHDDAASTANTAATSSNKDQIKLENDEKEFPDEVNTPDDVPARKRFARYRALRSFRSSPWDPQESLPRDYARIFQSVLQNVLFWRVIFSGRAPLLFNEFSPVLTAYMKL